MARSADASRTTTEAPRAQPKPREPELYDPGPADLSRRDYAAIAYGKRATGLEPATLSLEGSHGR